MRRVYCTPVLFVGVLLLVSGNARGEAIAVADHPSEVRATATSAPPAAVVRTWRDEWFRDRDYFDPLIAEPRAPQIAFTIPAWIPDYQRSDPRVRKKIGERLLLDPCVDASRLVVHATRPSRATSKTQRGRSRSTRTRGGKQ